jgi:hypothetical protein
LGRSCTARGGGLIARDRCRGLDTEQRLSAFGTGFMRRDARYDTWSSLRSHSRLAVSL